MGPMFSSAQKLWLRQWWHYCPRYRYSTPQSPPDFLIMLVAKGCIRTTNTEKKFTASFIVEDFLFNFRESFLLLSQFFVINNATLEYSGVRQLKDSQDLTGDVCICEVHLALAEGASTNGNLLIPSNQTNFERQWGVGPAPRHMTDHVFCTC